MACYQHIVSGTASLKGTLLLLCQIFDNIDRGASFSFCVSKVSGFTLNYAIGFEIQCVTAVTLGMEFTETVKQCRHRKK